MPIKHQTPIIYFFIYIYFLKILFYILFTASSASTAEKRCKYKVFSDAERDAERLFFDDFQLFDPLITSLLAVHPHTFLSAILPSGDVVLQNVV